MKNALTKNKVKNLFLVLFFLLPFLSQATVWRVNGNPGIDADYPTIQQAVDNAADGDTIYVEPLVTGGYDVSFVNKTLNIIGSGYFLDVNDSTQYQNRETIIDPIQFNEGSEGSLLSGFVTTGNILLNTCCITIENCQGDGAFLFLFSSADNCFISNCFYRNGDVTVERISESDNPGAIGVTGTVISNSVFRRFEADLSNPSQETVLSMVVNHCVVSRNSGSAAGSARNTTFSNCIILTTASVDGTCTFINTATASSQFGFEVNTIDITGDPLFDGNSLNELGYNLEPNSPAIGAATDGTDCGIFGGIKPYKFAGMPNIPSIFELSVGALGNPNSQTLEVNLKAKSHD